MAKCVRDPNDATVGLNTSVASSGRLPAVYGQSLTQVVVTTRTVMS